MLIDVDDRSLFIEGLLTKFVRLCWPLSDLSADPGGERKSQDIEPVDIDDKVIYSDLSRRERSPQMVVKSKGILPKMAERFRLRIYNKLPRY